MSHQRTLNGADTRLPSTGLSHDVLMSATAQIVSAYIAQRGNEQLNLSSLTADVYATLLHLSENTVLSSQNSVMEKSSKVSVEDSVRPDYLICLEDGKRVKMLKRYLKTNYNMTPEEYRNRWNLPESYPMVAPNYAEVRSQLAKKIGLGTRGMSLAAKRMSQQQHAA